MAGKIMMVGGGLALFGASTLLAGCGSDGTTTTPAANVTTSPPAPPSNTTTQGPSANTTTPSAHNKTTTPHGPVDPRTPLYVALRMDDISVGELEQVQADVMNWFSVNKVPFNFHIITYSDDGPWPTDCKTDPSSSQFCTSPIVQKVQEVYDAGEIVGTSDNAWLYLGCHAHNHDNWPAYIRGENTEGEWQRNDLNTSMGYLRAAYPHAEIRSFAAPANAANNQSVQACLEQGLDIVTTQATVTCNAAENPGTPPGYNYGVGPCGNSDGSGNPPYSWDCIPPEDTYFTTAGMQKANGVYSLPCSSANSNFQQVEIGLSVDDTLGVGTCGCTGNVCPMIANAKEMADKSNGLHWTVLIMHPQTAWDDSQGFPPSTGQTWPEWLDEFKEKAAALEDYNVVFVTMAQMTELHAAASTQMLFA